MTLGKAEGEKDAKRVVRMIDLREEKVIRQMIPMGHLPAVSGVVQTAPWPEPQEVQTSVQGAQETL
jgi:hypothetical protein